MIALLRRIYRFTALIVWFAITGFMALTQTYGGWESIRKISFVTRLWASGICRIIRLKINVHGDISSFKGGLIVSNHQGYFDIFTHAAIFPIRFTPKADIATWPVLGWFLALSRGIWVDRSSRQKSAHVLKQFIDTMRQDIPLIIYPEGSSSDGKDGLLPFKSTPFEAATKGNFPILPVLTLYRDAPIRDCPIPWHGDLTLVPHFWKIMGCPHFEADLYVLPTVHPEGRDRKEMAKLMHELMEKKIVELIASHDYYSSYRKNDDAASSKPACGCV